MPPRRGLCFTEQRQSTDIPRLRRCGGAARFQKATGIVIDRKARRMQGVGKSMSKRIKRTKRIRLFLFSGLSAGALASYDPETKAPLSADNVYTNNYYVPGVGHYHAPFCGWFALPYNHFDPGKRRYFYGGQWGPSPGRASPIFPRPRRRRRRGPKPCGRMLHGAVWLHHRTTVTTFIPDETPPIQCRPDWPARVESVGLTYHSHENGPYWDESACYEFTAREVDVLEAAANALHFLCIDAAEAVIKNNWWARLEIAPAAVPVILRSWERDDFSLYGRFDLVLTACRRRNCWNTTRTRPPRWWRRRWRNGSGCGNPSGADQFNSIHERLIAAWRRWRGKPSTSPASAT